MLDDDRVVSRLRWKALGGIQLPRGLVVTFAWLGLIPILPLIVSPVLAQETDVASWRIRSDLV